MILFFNEYSDDEDWQSLNGHILWRMTDYRAAELRDEDRRRRGRPRLRWEECVMRYEIKAREEGRLEEEDKRQRTVEKSIR